MPFSSSKIEAPEITGSLFGTASWALSASWAPPTAVGFNREIHVSSGSGNDITGDGSYTKPYQTVTKALTVLGNTAEALTIHPGTYRENVTVNQLNVSIQSSDIVAGGIVYLSGSITFASANAASSVRAAGIMVNSVIHNNVSPLYMEDMNILNSYLKSGNAAYNENIHCSIQTPGGITITGAGTVVFQGDKQALLTVNNTSAIVVVKNSLNLTGATVTAGTFAAIDSSIYSVTSGSPAITSAAGSIVQLYSSNIATSAGSPERIAISGFLGYDDITFNKNLSTLGTSLGVRAHFQNADINGLTATGSLFGTASWAQNATAANTASWATNAISANTASWANNFLTSSVTNATFAQSASYFSGSNIEVSNLVVKGTASIQYLDVQYQSSSVIYSSGSNIFGDAPNDTQTLNGQVNIINSALISGSLVVLGGITGSLLGTASYANNAAAAVSSSYALSSSYAQSASYSVSSSVAVSASFATSASYSINSDNAVSASVAVNAQTASYFLTSSVTSASLAQTASYFLTSSVTSASFANTASWAQNAVTASIASTASYALNGGVTQLLAGSNVTLSPTNGLGQVTISSTGGGGSSFNTATGSYGSFYSTQTQTNVAGTARSMSLNVTDITNGVLVSGSTNPYNTYIKTENAGVYNIQFSAQVDKSDAGADEIWIWLRKNGTNLTETATSIKLTGNADHQVAAWNFFANAAANDYFQLMWYSPDANVRLHAEPAFGVVPGIPSLIVTANRIDQFLSNTGSFSGSFNGSLFGTASWANNFLTSSVTSASLAQSASALVSGADITVGDLNISGIQTFIDDAEAAAGGVPVNGVYRNGNFLLIRIA